MSEIKDLQVQLAIDQAGVRGVFVDHRIISPGDEFALLPDELDAVANCVTKVRRASGAARIVARSLFDRVGQAPCAIRKSRSGMPVWPEGLVGSLAHDAEVAVAAVAMRREFLSVGVDVEPAERLDPDLLDLIATAWERGRVQHDRFGGRLLFAAKEAVYKAVYPMDGLFLDHHDVEVCFDSGTARVRDGRVVNFRFGIANHIVVLAFVSA